jgi:diacylglycerol kinase
MSTWYKKFACAFVGTRWAVKRQNSFWVHCFFAFAALMMGGWLQIEAWRWAAICLAITTVMVAELFNTAIEEFVKVLHPEQNKRIGRALDISAGAVLIAAVGSVVIGLITLGPPLVNELLPWLGW